MQSQPEPQARSSTWVFGGKNYESCNLSHSERAVKDVNGSAKVTPLLLLLLRGFPHPKRLNIIHRKICECAEFKIWSHAFSYMYVPCLLLDPPDPLFTLLTQFRHTYAFTLQRKFNEEVTMKMEIICTLIYPSQKNNISLVWRSIPGLRNKNLIRISYGL